MSLLAFALVMASPSLAADPPSADLDAPRLERREHLIATHRALKYGTAGALLVTGSLGVVALINQPTLLGDGKCLTGNPVLGDYGCNELGLLHAGSGVVTLGLYATDMGVTVGIPRAPGSPLKGPYDHGGAHRAFTGMHIAGMILQPILGLLAANPTLIGVDDPSGTGDYARTMRTAHVGVGLLTAGSYWTTLAIEEGDR
jgi:hypothetical protein